MRFYNISSYYSIKRLPTCNDTIFMMVIEYRYTQKPHLFYCYLVYTTAAKASFIHALMKAPTIKSLLIFKIFIRFFFNFNLQRRDYKNVLRI